MPPKKKTGKVPAKVLKTQVAKAEERLQQHPEEIALKTLNDPAAAADGLRTSLASLYQLNATSTSTSNVARQTGTNFATSKIQTQPHYSAEQLWGQLSVLYAPVLKNLETAVDKAEEHDGMIPVGRGAKSKQKKGKLNVFDIADGEEEEEGDEAPPADIDQQLQQDDGEDDLFPSKKKKEKADKKDAWRYAFGMEGDADEDEEDQEKPEEGRRGYRHHPDVDADEDDEDAAALAEDDEEDALDEEDDGEYHERDFGEDHDEFGGEEEEEGDDNNNAMAELYGDGNFDEDENLGGDFDDEEDDAEDAVDGYGGGAGERGRQQQNHDEQQWGDEAAAGRRKRPADDEAMRQEEEGEEEEEEEQTGEGFTNFELQERKRLRETQDLEETRLFEKHWTMTGEAAGGARPKDSLIDTPLDFEHAMRPVPVITEAITEKLEDRIKRRVADSNYDDVKRRQMRTTAADLQTTRRDEGIDAQKSKLSLMDLYEKEYLEKQKSATGESTTNNAEPLTEVEKDELRALNMWKRLSQHLDALSNFFFTPKPVMEDSTARVRAVEQQAPAIALESVGISGVHSAESAVAPQDLFRQRKGKFVGVSKDEMDPKEKQALRRAHKTSSKMKKDIVEGRKEGAKKEREQAKKAAEAA